METKPHTTSLAMKRSSGSASGKRCFHTSTHETFQRHKSKRPGSSRGAIPSLRAGMNKLLGFTSMMCFLGMSLKAALASLVTPKGQHPLLVRFCFFWDPWRCKHPNISHLAVPVHVCTSPHPSKSGMWQLSADQKKISHRA